MARLNGGGVSKAVAITDTFVVANVADLITLTTARIGDVGIVTGTNETYILQYDPYSTPGNWVELLSNSVIAGGANAGNVAYFNNSYTIIGSDDFNYSNASKSLIVGTGNTIGTGAGHLVFGSSNSVSGDNGTGIIGNSNNLSAALQYCFVIGYQNTIGSVNEGYAIGAYNSVSGGASIAIGESHNVGGSYNIVAGQSNNTTGSHNLITGQGNASTTTGTENTHQAIFGKSNDVEDNYCGIVAGEDVVLTGAGSGFNYAFGTNHTITGGQFSLVNGNGNTLAGEYNVVLGNGNNVTSVGDHNTLIGSSLSLTLTGSNYNTLIGEIMAVNHGVTHNAMFGKSITVQNGGYNILGGQNLFAGGDHNAVFGEDNGNGPAVMDHNLIAGKNNHTTQTGNAMFGQDNTIGQTSYTVIGGFNNSMSGQYSNSAVFGANHVGNFSYCNILTGEGHSIGSTGIPAGWNAVFGKTNTGNDMHYSVVGGQGHTTTGMDYGAVFGLNHVVSTAGNLVAGGSAGTGHNVSGYDNIVGGRNNTVTGTDNIVGGDTNNVGGNSGMVVGDNNIKTGNFNYALGNGINVGGTGNNMGVGNGITLSGRFSFAAGATLTNNGKDAQSIFGWGGSAVRHGEFVHTGNLWNAGGGGDAQHSFVVAKAQTTDATQTTMTLNFGSSEYIDLENNTTYLFMVDVVARRTDVTGERAAYHMEFEANRDANAASTTISTITKNVIHEDVAAWDVTATADTTNGRIDIKVTGENAKTIRWVAKVSIIQVKG